MSLRTSYVSAWLILAATVLASVIAYPYVPERIATHWNMAGQVNGTMSALWGSALLPIVMLLVLLVLIAIPHIDPMKANIDSFRRQYNGFITILMLFFAVIQAALLSWNLGEMFDLKTVILPAVGILFFYIGIILPQTKRNWFIGIRTPWTISSDIVWQKTHKLGGALFKILGILIVLSVFVPALAIPVILSLVAIVVLWLFVYSYIEYNKQELGTA